MRDEVLDPHFMQKQFCETNIDRIIRAAHRRGTVVCAVSAGFIGCLQ
jgi:acetolactate synthase regulatory subunit